MATFRKRGKRWQVIIRKSGRKPVVKTFSTKSQAETWVRITESDMDRQAWEEPTLLREHTLDDVIAAMNPQRASPAARRQPITTFPVIWVRFLPSPT